MAIMIQQCSITQLIGGILITVTGCSDTIQTNIFDGQIFPQPSYPLHRVYVHVVIKKFMFHSWEQRTKNEKRFPRWKFSAIRYTVSLWNETSKEHIPHICFASTSLGIRGQLWAWAERPMCMHIHSGHGAMRLRHTDTHTRGSSTYTHLIKYA